MARWSGAAPPSKCHVRNSDRSNSTLSSGPHQLANNMRATPPRNATLFSRQKKNTEAGTQNAQQLGDAQLLTTLCEGTSVVTASTCTGQRRLTRQNGCLQRVC